MIRYQDLRSDLTGDCRLAPKAGWPSQVPPLVLTRLQGVTAM